MPIKNNKLDTDAKLTARHQQALLEHRDHIIKTQYNTKEFTIAEIAFVFNLRIQNISKIIKTSNK